MINFCLHHLLSSWSVLTFIIVSNTTFIIVFIKCCYCRIIMTVMTFIHQTSIKLSINQPIIIELSYVCLSVVLDMCTGIFQCLNILRHHTKRIPVKIDKFSQGCMQWQLQGAVQARMHRRLRTQPGKVLLEAILKGHNTMHAPTVTPQRDFW